MSSHRPFAGRRRKGEDEGGETKTACYARQDLCGSGFVFALYRATMSRQWRDNGGITTATRRHREWPSLFPRLVFRSSGREGRKDARRKNERNNGFIISGLYRRAAFHCSTSFLPLPSSPPLLLHRRPGTSLKRAETLSCCAFRRR